MFSCGKHQKTFHERILKCPEAEQDQAVQVVEERQVAERQPDAEQLHVVEAEQLPAVPLRSDVLRKEEKWHLTIFPLFYYVNISLILSRHRRLSSSVAWRM